MSRASKKQRGEQLYSLRRLQIPSVAVDGTTVSGANAKSVLRCVDDHGATCWAGAETIALETCLSERTVRRACKALESLGLVSADHRDGKTSVYQINWPNIQATLDAITGVATESTPDAVSAPPDVPTGHPGRCVNTPGRCVRRNDRNVIIVTRRQ